MSRVKRVLQGNIAPRLTATTAHRVTCALLGHPQVAFLALFPSQTAHRASTALLQPQAALLYVNHAPQEHTLQFSPRPKALPMRALPPAWAAQQAPSHCLLPVNVRFARQALQHRD